LVNPENLNGGLSSRKPLEAEGRLSELAGKMEGTLGGETRYASQVARRLLAPFTQFILRDITCWFGTPYWGCTSYAIQAKS
jgi:hypothetical protein